MKKGIVLIFVLIFAISSKAQTYDQVGWIAKFGMAVGFTPSWVKPDFSVINNELNNLGLDGFTESGLITFGGGGYAYLMFLENLRIGGTGFSGTTATTSNLGNLNREVVYTVGGGALTLEYTLPSIKNMALSFGVMLGGGSADIEIFQKSGSQNWDDVWSDPVNGTGNTYEKITNSYYNISPVINLDIPVNRYLALRIGTGYQFTLFNEWEYDNEQDLENVPSEINSDMFFIQTGIFIGFFAF